MQLLRSKLARLGSPVLLLAALTAPAVAQDFEGVITARVRGMPGGGEMKTFVKGNRYRMEITVPNQGAMAIIADPAAGETYMVMPAQSMYMVMKMADAEKMAEDMLRRNAVPETSLTATGRKETIAGKSCEVYRMKGDNNQEMDMCLAMGIPFKLGASFFGGPPTPGRPRATPSWAGELAKKGAFPLKVSEVNGNVIWEVVSFEAKTLEGALFVPPSGFRRMDMPSFGRPPAE